MGRSGGRDEEEEYLPLFETKKAQAQILAYRFFTISIFIGICLVWVYRAKYVPGGGGGGGAGSELGLGRWAWMGLFGAEIWFGLYWLLTQSHRWNRIYRHTFKHRLSHRYEERLPSVDIFVCTADPMIEPPTMVINTVLSVMAYDYPPEKLSVYLSDDGGSDLTFYALLEASHFSKYWIPFCKKFKVEPRSPAAYFSTTSNPHHQPASNFEEWSAVKTLYEEMVNRIQNATQLGRIPEEMRAKHKGFLEWDSVSSPRDHQTILQILIDGRADSNAVDMEGCKLPTLVYLAREKRPQHHHNFKAGAVNALIRVSSMISNGQIILNVDCDMYSNSSESIRDALCFFMDEEKGHEIAYVQFPQNFNNISKHDVYGGALAVIRDVEFCGLDGNGGPLYIGTGCFHRRETLLGKKYSKESKGDHWETDTTVTNNVLEESVAELENRVKGLANCSYEKNTQWGNEMGLKYGCPVEDVLTGLTIQCRGWKSVYFNPKRWAFLGVAPNTLGDVLVQHKRWSEGDFQIFLSKYNPFLYGHQKISLALKMGYSAYCLWAPNCLPTLYYLVIPPLCLLKGIPLFPKITSPWFLPFMYLIMTKYTYSLVEFLYSSGTLRGWWHGQRMWMFKRTTSYLFAFIDSILKLFGFGKSAFVITSKVADGGVSKRYEKDMIEFGTSSPIFTTIIGTLALINLFSLVGGLKRVFIDMKGIEVLEQPLMTQIGICGLVVLVNLPVYQGLFFRKDKGRIPTSLTLKSVILAISACMIMIFTLY